MAALVLFLLALCAGGIGLYIGRRPGETRDFTLILAYWQTLRSIRAFPNEMDPRQNPAFQPARNAIKVAKGLAPSALLLFCALLASCAR